MSTLTPKVDIAPAPQQVWKVPKDIEPGCVIKLSGLFDHEEADRVPPYGEAIDLGCGSAI